MYVESTAKVARWAGVAVIGVMCFEVFMRYVVGHPTMWATAMAPMLGAVMITLGWGYVHQQHANVRVDFLYLKVSARGKAIIDVAGDIFVFFPLLATLVYSSLTNMMFSWEIGEQMTETYWYPPAGPIKTVVFVGIVLLALQGVANFCRSLAILRAAGANND